jgi:glycerate kinase
MLTDVSIQRVVIAPDSFKGTATALEVATAIAAGWSAVRPQDALRLYPMADGGEGTLDAFEQAVAGSCRMPVMVDGPDDQNVHTQWLLLPDGTGVVELANTSGLGLLATLRPFDAHTRGFGQAIAAALDFGVERLFLALGGSASTDGGAGALTALGARFTDAAGHQVRPGNRGLADLAAVDLTGLRSLPAGGAFILSDVTNPLLGENGAATVFAPQKGANSIQVVELEVNLGKFARLAALDPGTIGTGAAGGTGYGLAVWGATTASGADAVGAALGLPAAIGEADIVVTGEGRFDAQSAGGKVPSYVAALAQHAATAVMLVAGRIEAPTDGFARAVSLTDLAGGEQQAMAEPAAHLRAAGSVLANAPYQPGAS